MGRQELPRLQVPAAAARVSTPPCVSIHLVNHVETQLAFSQLLSKNVGRLVSVRGTVTRVAGAYTRQLLELNVSTVCGIRWMASVCQWRKRHRLS